MCLFLLINWWFGEELVQIAKFCIDFVQYWFHFSVNWYESWWGEFGRLWHQASVPNTGLVTPSCASSSLPKSILLVCKQIWNVIKEKYTKFHLTVKIKDHTIWTRMQEKEFLKSVIYNRNSHVYIWYFVPCWACCEVTVILTKRVFPGPTCT